MVEYQTTLNGTKLGVRTSSRLEAKRRNRCRHITRENRLRRANTDVLDFKFNRFTLEPTTEFMKLIKRPYGLRKIKELNARQKTPRFKDNWSGEIKFVFGMEWSSFNAIYNREYWTQVYPTRVNL